MMDHRRTTASPVHMTDTYWCQPGKSRWFRKNEPFSDYGRDVTCPACLTVLDGSSGDAVVHMGTDTMVSSRVVPLCGLTKTRIHTRRADQITCRRCLDLHARAVASIVRTFVVGVFALLLVGTLFVMVSSLD